MNTNMSDWIEYISLFVVMMLIINYAVDSYFSKYVQPYSTNTHKVYDEDDNNILLTDTDEEEAWPPSPPEPIYGIYHTSCFSNEITRALYQKIVIKEFYFLDQLWMETFSEILVLHELANDVSVIKDNAKVIHLVNGTRGMEGAETAELYEAYNLQQLSIQSVNELINLNNHYSIEKFQLKIITLLLFYIDEITCIHFWSNVQDDTDMLRIELVGYLTRKLSSDQKNCIVTLIQEHQNHFDKSDISLCISQAKSKLKTVTKLVKENDTFNILPKSSLTKHLKKAYLTIEEIQKIR